VIRIRVGQKYLEAGEERKPSVRYVEVVAVDPLVVQPETWHGKRGHDEQAYDPESLLQLPLAYDPELNPEELREALIGRRIVDIEVETDRDTFPQGDGDLTLTLDNGRRVSLRSWGHDAWGMGASIAPPLSV
jgi:hypothetical protein